MADPARAKRMAKRISTIVASAIEYEIKDPRLAGVADAHVGVERPAAAHLRQRLEQRVALARLRRDREERDHEEEAEEGAGFREELFEGGHI